MATRTPMHEPFHGDPERRTLANETEFGDRGTPDQFRQDLSSMPPPKAPDGNLLGTSGAPISKTWAAAASKSLPAAKPLPPGPVDGPLPPNPDHIMSQALGHGNLLFTYDDEISRDDRPPMEFDTIFTKFIEVASTDPDLNCAIAPELGVNMGLGGKGPMTVGYNSFEDTVDLAKHVPYLEVTIKGKPYKIHVTARRRVYDTLTQGYSSADRKVGELEGAAVTVYLNSTGNYNEADYISTYAKPAMLTRFFTDRGFKVYGASRPKMRINDPTTGEMVSAGTGARGTRICMTIRHETLLIEQALMDGLLPTRCSIDFKPQYSGDKARSYELGYTLFAPQIATKELKLLLNNDSSLFHTRGCHRPTLAVMDHPCLAALIPEGKTLRYCMCAQLGSKETAEGRKNYSKETAPRAKSYHKDAAPASTMLSPVATPCLHYMVATVTAAGHSSEPAPPPYVGRCKRGAICRFQHDAPGFLPAKDIPCDIEKCKGKGCNYKAPHGKM